MSSTTVTSAAPASTVGPSCAFQPKLGSSMPNETEAMAFALIRLLHEATDGDSMQWRTIRRLDGATDGAVARSLPNEAGCSATTPAV